MVHALGAAAAGHDGQGGYGDEGSGSDAGDGDSDGDGNSTEVGGDLGVCGLCEDSPTQVSKRWGPICSWEAALCVQLVSGCRGPWLGGWRSQDDAAGRTESRKGCLSVVE